MAPRPRKSHNGLWVLVFVAPFCIFYGVFSLFPNLYNLYMSFFDWQGIASKTFVGAANYLYLVVKDPLFLKAALNTLIIMAMYIPVLIMAGVVIAAFLSSRLVRFNRFFQIVSFLPYITMAIAVGLLFSLMFDSRSGILNGLLMRYHLIDKPIYWLRAPYARYVVVLLMVWRYLGYTIIFYTAGILSIPEELFEAARADGAPARVVFFRITVPLLRPIMLFLLITFVIGGFQLFEEPLLMLNGWGNSASGGAGFACYERTCLTSMWYVVDTAFGSTYRFGLAAAASYILFLIILLASILGFRVIRMDDGS